MRLKLINNFTLTLPYLIKIRTSDFHKLLQLLITKKKVWKKCFASLKALCKKPKLKEFQFKFMHQIIVTKRALFRLVFSQMMTV